MLDHIELHIHNTFQILTIYVQNFYILIVGITRKYCVT